MRKEDPKMKNILKSIETAYIDTPTLLNLLARYKKPREAILRMIKNEELIRLKNGIYLISENIYHKDNTIIPFEQVANFLYGPSYVSMEWALSFYGMIPEKVHTVTSMTLGKNKAYHTPIGDFSYLTLPPKYYSVGVTQKKSPDFLGGFLIASPEKALADMVFKTCKKLDKQELKEELIDSRRIDPYALQSLNKKLLEIITQSYHVKSVYNLQDLIGLL